MILTHSLHSLQIVQMIFGAISRLGAEVGGLENNYPENNIGNDNCSVVLLVNLII